MGYMRGGTMRRLAGAAALTFAVLSAGQQLKAATFFDVFDGFSNTNAGGTTFSRTITPVDTVASTDGTFELTAFGDFNGSSEYVAVTIEGLDLGRFLDNDPDNDSFFDNASFGDIGAQYGEASFSASATIPQATLQTIVADGSLDVTYHLGPDVHNLQEAPEEFLAAAITYSKAPAASPTTVHLIDGQVAGGDVRARFDLDEVGDFGEATEVQAPETSVGCDVGCNLNAHAGPFTVNNPIAGDTDGSYFADYFWVDMTTSGAVKNLAINGILFSGIADMGLEIFDARFTDSDGDTFVDDISFDETVDQLFEQRAAPGQIIDATLSLTAADNPVILRVTGQRAASEHYDLGAFLVSEGASSPPVDFIEFSAPFAATDPHRITQTPGGETSHGGGDLRFAIDFQQRGAELDPETGRTANPVSVLSSADGWIYTFPDTGTSFGNFVAIDHGPAPNDPDDRLFSVYAHLDQIFSFENGDFLSAGTPIGVEGNTGETRGETGIHIHWDVYTGDPTADPWTCPNCFDETTWKPFGLDGETATLRLATSPGGPFELYNSETIVALGTPSTITATNRSGAAV